MANKRKAAIVTVGLLAIAGVAVMPAWLRLKEMGARGAMKMNAKIKWLTLLTIAPVALLAFAACGSDDAPASVPDAKSTFEVPAGGTDEIIAQLRQA